MFVCIGLLVKVFRILLTSWWRPLQSTPLSSPAWRAATVVVEMYSLMGMVAGVTANFGPFCSKDFSSGVSSFFERLITHLSWILGGDSSVESVGCLGGHLGGCCGGSGDKKLEFLNLGVLVL